MERIQEKPADKLHNMRAWNGRYSVPHYSAGFLRMWSGQFSQGQPLDTLGIKVNLAIFLARQAFQQFGESALRAVAPVNEW